MPIKMARDSANRAGEERQTLYNRDYYTWTPEQARALRQRRVSSLYWENLAEEVEDLSKSERRELQNRLELLLEYLLKWQYQPKRRTRTWTSTITIQRQLLDENRSLKPTVPNYWPKPTSQLASRSHPACQGRRR